MAIDHFASLTDLSTWQTFDQYLETCDDRLFKDIEINLNRRKELREMLMSDPAYRSRVKQITPDLLDWAKNELFSGNVCGVDGTLSIIPSTSGGRARIGVVATSYKSDKIERVVYISYRELAEPVKDAPDYFKKLKTVSATSGLFIRAVMEFAERDLGLKRQEKWKFVHGELLPYELRTGAGRTKTVLPRALELGKRLIESTTTIGIIEGSEDLDLLNAAETLDRFEYLHARGLDQDFQDFLEGTDDPENPGQRIRGAHFGEHDRSKFRDFIDTYARQIKVGVFKVGLKPFLFQAHRDNFEKAAALVMADAALQPMRGFPLLLDYADQICSQHLAGRDFERQIQFKTARFGIEALGYEIDPRKTRRR